MLIEQEMPHEFAPDRIHLFGNTGMALQLKLTFLPRRRCWRGLSRI